MTAARLGRDDWTVGVEGDPTEILFFLLNDLTSRYMTTDLTTLHSVRRYTCENTRCTSPDTDLSQGYPAPSLAPGHSVVIHLEPGVRHALHRHGAAEPLRRLHFELPATKRRTEPHIRGDDLVIT